MKLSMATTSMPCLMLAVGVLPPAGCPSAGSTTCSEFYDMNGDEQQDVLKDLLREHDLRVYDTGNIVEVTKAAVDWDSSYW
ncbi:MULTISPECIES: hypothetical protein [Actinomyces]|uniref:Uncharacterized protein n=1 Tax=Actinomyces respiraculi TaxID=2744574 RepID=A0A7T0PVD1_9ACTO|nr:MULTISPECIES: hypothetical protein [Actinomyces]QPL04569.1 hypothetical protein ID810_07095 [Actinomyces respiraculi]